MTLVVDGRVLHGAVGRLFAGTTRPGPPAVGIELELIPCRPAAPYPAVVGVAELRELLRGIPAVTFEPGGQLELNPAPGATPARALGELAGLVSTVEARLSAAGIRVVATGLNPWHTSDEVGLQLRSDRYLAMDAHYQSLGTAGRSFMRQTASTQICIDLAPGEQGRLQWRAANLVAPVLAAIFANAPVHQRSPLGHNGGRTAVCRAADPVRSGHSRFPATGDPVDDYARFAADARPLDETFAGDGGIDQHLTTLFPPVRPRGRYLEFRAIDALPMGEVRTATTVVATLLAHRPSTLAAAALCSRADQLALWDHAASDGIRDRTVRRLATGLAAIARDGLAALPAGYLPPEAPGGLARLRERIEAGRAPGDGGLRAATGPRLSGGCPQGG